MEFSRQGFWNGLPFPSPEDLPNSRIQPMSLSSPALAGGYFTTLPPGKPNQILVTKSQKNKQRHEWHQKGLLHAFSSSFHHLSEDFPKHWGLMSPLQILYSRSGLSAAKSLQSYPTVCDPIDGSPPGSPSLGFSRQEHWSGLPFPSPVHESEKWKWSHSVVSDS